jgi:iron complex transport system substrate-binding protein
MVSTSPRIVSLIPSATEILASLGLTDWIVGRSHECDYPTVVQTLPICTEPKFNPDGSSIEIHERVTDLLQTALSVYRVKTDLLEQLQPTHILTQAQCEVCAVSLGDVEQAVATLTQTQPQIISLQPNTLADIWTDIQQVATVLGRDGSPLISTLQERVIQCREQASRFPQPTVACIEWIDPLMAAGNWIPELVTLAGGQSLFGVPGQHSPWLEWSALQAANPEVIIFMPCGFDLERTRQEAHPLLQQPDWQALQAVQSGQIYITDGNQYFNRPGPRLVDSLEILAEILHPELEYGFEGLGWQRLSRD